MLLTAFAFGLLFGFFLHSLLYTILKEDNVDQSKYYFLRKWIRVKHPKVKLPTIAAKTTDEIKELEKKTINETVQR